MFSSCREDEDEGFKHLGDERAHVVEETFGPLNSVMRHEDHGMLLGGFNDNVSWVPYF